MPPTAGAPPGWAIFGRHVDDGVGVAAKGPTIAYLVKCIEMDWVIKLTKWQKVLGYHWHVLDDGRVVISCYPVIEAAVAAHCDKRVVKPKHPYTGAIGRLQPDVMPHDGTNERARYDAMQRTTRTLLGVGIWASRAHTQMTYGVNKCCGYMAQPTWAVNREAQHVFMHELAQPRPLVFGSGTLRSLVIVESPVPPFTLGAYEWGLHGFVDANLGVPPDDERADAVPIADGFASTADRAASRAVQGVAFLLAGAPVLCLSQRMHLTAPDSHTS